METPKEHINKVKLFASDEFMSYWSSENTEIYQAGGDWWELNDEEYNKLIESVDLANSRPKRLNPTNERYFIVTHVVGEYDKQRVFKAAEQFTNYLDRQQKREDNRRKKEEKERENKKLERKRLQLEKLKKELGE